MKLNSRVLALSLALLAITPTAFAHKAWIMPSQTVISGENPSVTFDAAISNDLFYFNHVPMPVERISVTAPDGSKVDVTNAAKLKYRSVFDLNLKQKGTYRIASVNSGLNATWDDNGTPKRWRGAVDGFAAGVPAGAKDLKVSQTVGRVETFVTYGAPSTAGLKLTGEGIEMVPVTHPNDLVDGEEATFKLMIDGQPAKGLEIEIVQGATRYRNSQDEMKVTTAADGSFKVTFKQPGMYWLETTSTDAKTSLPQAKERRLSYVATLEVLPQ